MVCVSLPDPRQLGVLVPAHLFFKGQLRLVETSLSRCLRSDKGARREGKHTALPAITKRTVFFFYLSSLAKTFKKHWVHLSTHHFAYHHLVVGSLLDGGIQRWTNYRLSSGSSTFFSWEKSEGALFLIFFFQAWQNCGKSRLPFPNSTPLVPLFDY